MSDTTQDKQQDEGQSEGQRDDQKDEIRPVEDETTSDDKTCPECGVPIYNLRKNCPNCGHEYSDEDYDEKDVGSEFTAGSEVPDEEVGEKVKEDVSGEEKTAHSDDESEDD
ncbi:MAG: hypothetical protein ABR579_10620 [Actinomycetota bacterium]